MIHSLGWPSVFYVFGGLGLLWYLWWDRQAASSPAEDGRISQRELRYINRNTAQTQVGGRARGWGRAGGGGGFLGGRALRAPHSVAAAA